MVECLSVSVGAGFDSQPGHTKDCKKVPITSLLGTEYSREHLGVRSPNNSWAVCSGFANLAFFYSLRLF